PTVYWFDSPTAYGSYNHSLSVGGPDRCPTAAVWKCGWRRPDRRRNMRGGPDWAMTTLMERIALIEVKLYQKANAYHLKSYAYYNGAHGPIRPPALAASDVPCRRTPRPPRCNRGQLPSRQVRYEQH